MIIADQILVSLFQANSYAQTLVDEIAAKSSQGEDICELEWQLILLGEWNRILTDFYSANFDENGQVITPAYETITLAEAQQILSQIKIAVGENVYPLTNTWQLGVWLESQGFIWDDNRMWLDALQDSI